MDMVDRARHTERIRELNDEFRTTLVGGEVLITPGVQELHGTMEVLECVRAFKDFTEDNDPHGEHDFISFGFRGQRVFAKIDYYAPDMQHGSEDPSDPEKTTRVLTVLLASEY